MAHASARPDARYYGWQRLGTARRWTHRGDSSRRRGLVFARREALAWSDADHGHDAHRHSGEKGWEGGRLDGARQRRTIPKMTLRARGSRAILPTKLWPSNSEFRLPWRES